MEGRTFRSFQFFHSIRNNVGYAGLPKVTVPFGLELRYMVLHDADLRNYKGRKFGLDTTSQVRLEGIGGLQNLRDVT